MITIKKILLRLIFPSILLIKASSVYLHQILKRDLTYLNISNILLSYAVYKIALIY